MLASSLEELRSPSPPVYALWVNVLWIMSLLLNLTAVGLADQLSGWSKQLTMVTQPRYEPHKQARILAFFLEGVHKSHLSVIEALPSGMLHLSVFLFLIGAIIHLWQFTLILAKIVLAWTIICATSYGYFTIILIFRPDTPYRTPFSLPAWYLFTGILFAASWALQALTVLGCFSHMTYCRIHSLATRSHHSLRRGLQRTTEEIALRSSSDISTLALMWTLSKLDNDHEVERYISGIPGFLCSPVVNDPLPRLDKGQKKKFLVALIQFLDLTFTPDLLPEPDRERRAAICKRAFDRVEMLHVYKHILRAISSGGRNCGLKTPEFGCVLKSWPHSDKNWDVNHETGLVVKAIFTYIIVGAQQHNDSWFVLASDELGFPEATLRHYAMDGASLSLAVLTYVIRLQFDHFREELWPKIRITNILREASKFNDVRNTLPEVQYEFCTLWNRIVHETRNTNDERLVNSEILEPIRKVYTDLHPSTGAGSTPWLPAFYLSMECDDPSHNTPEFGRPVTTQAGSAFAALHDTNVPSSSNLATATYHASGLMDVSPSANSLIRRPLKTPASPPLPRV